MPSRKEAFNDHEYDCPHRNVMCPNEPTCNKTISLSKLLLHVKDAHRESIEEKTNSHKSDLVIPPEIFKGFRTWTPWLSTHFTLNTKEFYSQIFRGPPGLFYLWVYVIGTPKEVDNFTYTLTLCNANKVIHLDSLNR